MARYRLHFVDHGGNAYQIEHFDAPDDLAAVEEARRRNVDGIGGGFDLFRGTERIHHHRRWGSPGGG